MREVPEWRGKHDDAKIPDRIRLRVFDRHGGICHLSGRRIQPGDSWDIDHIVPLCNGGEHRFSNLAPVIREKHREKTARDVAERAKNDRIKKRHIGIKKTSRFSCSRNSKFKKRLDGTVVLR